jgi:hypothetical protein
MREQRIGPHGAVRQIEPGGKLRSRMAGKGQSDRLGSHSRIPGFLARQKGAAPVMWDGAFERSSRMLAGHHSGAQRHA